MNPFLTKKYGFIESKIDENIHYILGDGMLSPAVIMPNGHGWGDFLPTDDLQNKNGLETMNCSNYGTLHALATLGKKKFGAQFQTALSERYTGVMTGTTQGGNDPHHVIETIRTVCGVIPEVFLPFNAAVTDWQDYYCPNPMSYQWYAVGKHWLKKYKINHQWVYIPAPGSSAIVPLKTALKFSPIGVAVFAWNQGPDGLYYSRDSFTFNHWVTLYDYVEGQYWCVFDSYDQTHKKLNWNFSFGQAKGYGLDFNVGGATLGDAIEPVYLPYAFYRLGALFK